MRRQGATVDPEEGLVTARRHLGSRGSMASRMSSRRTFFWSGASRSAASIVKKAWAAAFEDLPSWGLDLVNRTSVSGSPRGEKLYALGACHSAVRSNRSVQRTDG